jgi:hypothetical protein
MDGGTVFDEPAFLLIADNLKKYRNISCNFLNLLCRRTRRGLIILVALTAHRTPTYWHVMAPRLLFWGYMPPNICYFEYLVAVSIALCLTCKTYLAMDRFHRYTLLHRTRSKPYWSNAVRCMWLSHQMMLCKGRHLDQSTGNELYTAVLRLLAQYVTWL